MLNTYDLSSVIQNFNATLGEFHEQFVGEAYPCFGGDMLHSDDPTGLLLPAATIAHRFLNKFEKQSDPSNVERLTDACYKDWIAYEEKLREHRFYAQSPQAKGVVYRAREILHRWFADFKVDFSDLEFTPGETFESSQGYVSIFQKLKRKDAWTVTHDAADDFVRLCYNNTSLKRCAKSFMAPLSSTQHRQLVARFNNAPHVGFAVFRDRMLNEVLTLVYGSRGSSVEKSNTKRRFINVEPLGNVLLQRVVGVAIRRVLAKHGNDLLKGKIVHALRISNRKVATIDFSNASDSVLLEVCELCFPGKVFSLLNRYRSPFVLIDEVYYQPCKLSSMGNGFTFETMSALLLAIARTLDSDATVYGDDVIIDNDAADLFIQGAQAIGFKVNHQKTFVNSRFRESCGAFYLDDYGYVTCYDIHRCENISDCISACNKFYLMSQKASDCQELCARAYRALSSLLPPCFAGPPRDDLITDYFYTERYRKLRMRSVKLRQLHIDIVLPVAPALRELGYETSDVSVCYVPKQTLQHASKKISVVPNQGAKYASYLYSGRRCDDLIRGTGSEVFNLHLVTPSGLLLSYAKLRDAVLQACAIFVSLYTPKDELKKISDSLKEKTKHKHCLGKTPPVGGAKTYPPKTLGPVWRPMKMA